MVHRASAKTRSLLSVGLDPDPAFLPVQRVYEFNRAIIEATCRHVAAYKLNLAYYEALGSAGLRDMERTIEFVRDQAPDLLLIGDGKRGDIGSTARMYARAMFETWGFDVATVNAWAGQESLAPFFAYADKGVLVWCRASNSTAGEFQDLPVRTEHGVLPLYEILAIRAAEWNNLSANIGVVVGGTDPRAVASVRGRCPGLPMLIPGVGIQGGAVSGALEGLEKPFPNLLVHISRRIIYASRDPVAYAGAAGYAAASYRDRINREASVTWGGQDAECGKLTGPSAQ